MLKICVLEPASKVRNKIFGNVHAAVKRLAIDVIVRDENHKQLNYHLEGKNISTPVVVVNGEVKSSGRIPNVDEITRWLEIKEIRLDR